MWILESHVSTRSKFIRIIPRGEQSNELTNKQTKIPRGELCNLQSPRPMFFSLAQQPKFSTPLRQES
jgi:hypothetical protein